MQIFGALCLLLFMVAVPYLAGMFAAQLSTGAAVGIYAMLVFFWGFVSYLTLSNK